MALGFALDENLRGLLWRAVVRHNQHGVYPIDVVRVGDPPERFSRLRSLSAVMVQRHELICQRHIGRL